MKFPWVNSAVLITLVTLGLTGYLGLVSGAEGAAWRLWLHGIGAYTLIILFVWKSRVILDASRRKNAWTRARVAFWLTLILLLATVLLGLLWTFDGPVYLGGFSLVSLHIYLALPVMAAVLWHVWRLRFIFRVKGALDRRLFIRTAASAALGAGLWRTVDLSKAAAAAPGASRRFTGSYERGSLTGRFPTVSWILDDPDPVDPTLWRLTVGGAVRQRLTFTFADLLAMPAVRRDVLLDCTGGWYTTQTWAGVPLAAILDRAGLLASAASVSIVAVSGYQRRFGLEEANAFLLAYDVAGRPLPHGHGAPLRLVAPDRRGFEWVKWVTGIYVNTTGPHWQLPLPLR